MKKNAKLLVRDAEAIGYRHVSTNSKGARRFEHSTREPFSLLPGATEHAVKHLRTALGLCAEATKRNPAAVRERQAQSRERQAREIEAHKALLVELQAERARMLSGYAADLTSHEVLAIEQAIERTEREIAETTRLMRAPDPAPRRAKHTAGAT